MKRFLKNASYLLISGLLLSTFNFANASVYDDAIISDLELYSPSKEYLPETDVNISEEILGINKIKILPDNKLYFLNNVKNWFNTTFAINKDVQIDTLYKISSEKLKELEKCIKLEDEDCVTKGKKAYKTAKNNIYTKINKLQKDSKNDEISRITALELDHYILLSQLDINYTNDITEFNLQNYSNFVKTLTDSISYKKGTKLAIDNDTHKSKLKNIVINGYFEAAKNYLNIEKRAVLEQIIAENYETLIKNINQISPENLEKTFQYYFYKINNTQKIVSQIALIDKLYLLQDDIAESPNKNTIKTAILNTKQIPISLLNKEIESLSVNESEEKIAAIFKTGEIEQVNLIELLNKYNNGKKSVKTYQLLEIKDHNLQAIYAKIKDITDYNQKEKYIENLLNTISPENKNLKKEILDGIEQNETNVNTKIIVSRLREKNELLTVDEDKEEKDEELSLTVCTFIYDPVCGEDEKTYGNECLAKKEGVEILHSGECKIYENDSLKNITQKELEQGWYYGNTSQKKPGTPATWVNIDSDTKNAKWINPKKITNLKGTLKEEENLNNKDNE